MKKKLLLTNKSKKKEKYKISKMNYFLLLFSIDKSNDSGIEEIVLD